jgi:tetratricopeptide (TPR) repeat protein
MYRRLTENNPGAFEPTLATFLDNLGLLYSNVQNFSESELKYKEALEIYRRLAENNPETYTTAITVILGRLEELHNKND